MVVNDVICHRSSTWEGCCSCSAYIVYLLGEVLFQAPRILPGTCKVCKQDWTSSGCLAALLAHSLGIRNDLIWHCCLSSAHPTHGTAGEHLPRLQSGVTE
ncbi:hypothetical protein BRADI_4g28173v3 [Brachypodium distachyon]|uniref:Uncharacterized protein n=1 Tax=Brachypodium distachyon TaxID=15368 RepID=A0A2K2CQU9_BRADI|nr:hypothetical protein BRADI_4g28173v3 [Brachypodium distachyon]